MSDTDYYNDIENLLEVQIDQIKRVYFLPNKQNMVHSLSKLVMKTRELKKKQVQNV